MSYNHKELKFIHIAYNLERKEDNMSLNRTKGETKYGMTGRRRSN
jgi:hypothetical protein